MQKPPRKGIFPLALLLELIATLILTPIFRPAVRAAGDITTFPIGAGFTDAIPHQIVRTKNDRLYIFAARQENTKDIAAYWTTVPGLPSSTADFNGQAVIQDTANPISVDAVYDGDSTIHVLVNNLNNNQSSSSAGILKDYPFSTVTDSFQSPITISTGNPTIKTDYIGTSGVSGMVDLSGYLHVAYWSNGKHIIHKLYTYDPAMNTLTQVGTNTQVDTSGSANHPSVAVSPADNSLTVAWVSEAPSPARILARVRSSSGTWSAIETVNTAPVWTSTNFGINIDQGPTMAIDRHGTKYLVYIENFDATGEYGHIHYVTNSGSGWVDTVVPAYSHDPVPAINAGGEIYMLGHGPEKTHLNINMYVMKKTGASTWGPLQLVAAAPSGSSFDASPSVRWSAVGNNRPDTIEFLYFLANAGSYYNTTLYYARISGPPLSDPANTAPPRNYFTVSTPSLSWNRVSWASAYEIQVDDSRTFTLPVLYKTIVNAPALAVTTDSFTPGTYYWRVRAEDSNGVWGAWSSIESFIISG